MNKAKTHSNYTDKWYTPPEWLAWARATLGTTDYFDPCPANWVEGDPSGLVGTVHGPSYWNHPGSRGSVKQWWPAFVRAVGPKIWCAFSVEQLRHMRPSPFQLPGWLVMPNNRISYIDARSGQLGKSPANWSVFWTNTRPSKPPTNSIVIRTGDSCI